MIKIMFSIFFDLLRASDGELYRYENGASLFARGDDVKLFLVLEEGEVKLSRSSVSGNELVLHRSKAPSIIAEASVYSATYHCDAICMSPCTIRKLSISSFFNLIDGNKKLSSLWSAHLAHSLQSARYRSEILTMKKVSQRLDAWLDWHGDNFPPKGKWKHIAVEIGVSPEALYRELATRKL